MSQKSELLKRQLANCKAELRSLKAIQQVPNQGTKTNSEGEEQKAQKTLVSAIGGRKFWERPAIVSHIGTVFFGAAGFIQFYNHSVAIWSLFSALFTYGFAIRVEVKELGKRRVFYDGFFICCLILAIVICGNLQRIEVVKSRQHEPTMTDLGKGIDSLQIMEAYFSNQWQNSQQQLSDSQKTLSEVKAATEPRRITSEQREKFIKILSEIHNVSKVPIKVIIGHTDNETENFAMQIREMLDRAGYGATPSELQGPIDESFKARGTNVLYTSDTLPDIKIPVDGGFDVGSEIVRIPDMAIHPTSPDYSGRPPEIIAVFSGSIPAQSTLATVMPMYPTAKAPVKTVIHAYCPNLDPNAVLLGVNNILMEVGIRSGPMLNNGILKPGEIAFFIPQKLY